MKWRDAALFFVLGLAANLCAAVFQPVPGYMDAEYYFAGALQLGNGQGFFEPYVWNYLDGLVRLPHPAFTYWMPLTSIIAAVGVWISKSSSFWAARSMMILLAALLPVLTGWIAGKITAGKPFQRFSIWVAAGSAVFSGFYLVYTSITETFVLYMLIGTLSIICAFPQLSPRLGLENGWRRNGLLGICVGLMHLTRADGIIWLVGILFLVGLRMFSSAIHQKRWTWNGIGAVLCVILGYTLVMGAWYARNLDIYGSLMPPGGSHTLWLTSYDQTYNYPAETITFQEWVDSGLKSILEVRVNAFWMNLKTLLVVQGNIFLLPLILVGLWRTRDQQWVRYTVGMWCFTLVLMSFVFPFAGSRGGFLHSGAAFQLIWWGMVPLGLNTVIEFGASRRNWSRKQARLVLGSGLIGLCAMLTIAIFLMRVIGLGEGSQPWRASWDQAVGIGSAMESYGISKEEIIMVNNPPGFFVAAGHPAIAIPNGDLSTIQNVSRLFNAKYLVIEANTITSLKGLYHIPETTGGLTYLGPVGEGFLFEVQQ